MFTIPLYLNKSQSDLSMFFKENILNGEHILNFSIDKTSKIGNLKSYLLQNYPNASIDFILNDNTKLEVFNKADYDKYSFESIFDRLNGSKIFITLNTTYGKIRIAQQAKGRSYSKVEGYENIPAWSRGKGEWKQLSPFYIKTDDGAIFENYYQSFKVFPKVDKQNKKDWKWPSEIHVDEENNPNEKWFNWHEALYHHDQPVRRPNGKNIPLFSFYKGEKLNLIEARKQIYINPLKELYRKHPVYQKLLNLVKNGKNIIIIEPDGPLLDLYPEGLEVNLKMLSELVETTNYEKQGYPEKYRPFGHGLTIAMALLEDLN